MPARPTGAVDLGPVKARLATVRAAQRRNARKAAQDLRAELYEFNHAQAVARGDAQPPRERPS